MGSISSKFHSVAAHVTNVTPEHDQLEVKMSYLKKTKINHKTKSDHQQFKHVARSNAWLNVEA